MISESEKQELRSALEKERERLTRSLSGFATRDPKDPSNWNARYPEMTDEGTARLDVDENADEVEEYETLLETEETLEGRLKDVERALEKISANAYGQCERCGEDIPTERLHANPAARFDVKHSNRTR
ncbi:MAG: TraR/DksA C4-type zinc finger protein [Candidatus Sungbacteria bacterium]|uniref:TraR/DksA C4-type zinc finger protein n=1 Tax=Candidatus Sungiibacteriota bacterium TaxID=2750080 RepID=A0A931SBX5_9BACT|nr:TraR/DksA C4-type zinc finger protein [Candidatus Sungbacteria bacterium]